MMSPQTLEILADADASTDTNMRGPYGQVGIHPAALMLAAGLPLGAYLASRYAKYGKAGLTNFYNLPASTAGLERSANVDGFMHPQLLANLRRRRRAAMLRARGFVPTARSGPGHFGIPAMVPTARRGPGHFGIPVRRRHHMFGEMGADYITGIVAAEQSAYAKGFHHAVQSGMHPQQAAAVCGLTPAEFQGAMMGWGMPKFIKRAARRVAKTAKRAGRLAVKLHTAPLKLAARGTAFLARKALYVAATPLRVAFNRVAAIRARKYRVPMPAAKQWVTAALKRKAGPFGWTIAKFATISGYPTAAEAMGYMGDDTMGLAPAAIIAAVGPGIVLLQQIMKLAKGDPGPDALPSPDADAAPEQTTMPAAPQTDVDSPPTVEGEMFGYSIDGDVDGLLYG